MAKRTMEKPNTDTTALNPADQMQQEQEAAKAAKRDEKAAKKRGKKGGGLIALLIIALIVIALAAAIALNLFGFRDAIVNNVLVHIPIVNNLVDPVEVEADLTPEELEAKVSALEAEIARLEQSADADAEEIERLRTVNTTYLKELDNLRDIEKQQLQFKADRENFDRMVAENDKTAFRSFYETMNPVNAEQIYREIVGDATVTKQMRDYVATFTAMDETNAAKGLEQMSSSDPDLVVRILLTMDADSRGAIMNEMTAQTVANLGRRMAPATPMPE